MGRRGPKATPTAILEARGSREIENRTHEPKPAKGCQECPTWLAAEAKREWAIIVPHLESLGLLTMVDKAALAAYCTAWAEFRQATETLQRKGRYITIKATGYVQSHPAVSQQRSAWAAIKTFSALFGLDPADRTKLHAEPVAEPDAGTDEQKFFGTVG